MGGVTDAAIAAMEALGARRDRIAAAVGPCIAQPSYEVDAAFAARFCDESPDNEQFFAPGAPDHCQFDLSGYVAARLIMAGVGQIEQLGLDTYAMEDSFFSFCRATHRNEASYGRQIALIALN